MQLNYKREKELVFSTVPGAQEWCLQVLSRPGRVSRGTGTKKWPFKKARAFVRKQGFAGSREYKVWRRQSQSWYLPSQPNDCYKGEWKDWHDWLGNGVWPFKKARAFVRKQGLNSLKDYFSWRKESKAWYLPGDPHGFYKEWKDWYDWLGTTGRGQKETKWPFKKARDFVRKQGFSDAREYKVWRKESQSWYLPSYPSGFYKDEWKGWHDWLGNDFWPFKKARAFVRKQGLNGRVEYCLWRKKSQSRYLPCNPSNVYKDEWKGWYDWLGNKPNWWLIKTHCLRGHRLSSSGERTCKACVKIRYEEKKSLFAGSVENQTRGAAAGTTRST